MKETVSLLGAFVQGVVGALVVTHHLSVVAIAWVWFIEALLALLMLAISAAIINSANEK